MSEGTVRIVVVRSTRSSYFRGMPVRFVLNQEARKSINVDRNPVLGIVDSFAAEFCQPDTTLVPSAMLDVICS
jgi:hypothetical protein